MRNDVKRVKEQSQRGPEWVLLLGSGASSLIVIAVTLLSGDGLFASLLPITLGLLLLGVTVGLYALLVQKRYRRLQSNLVAFNDYLSENAGSRERLLENAPVQTTPELARLSGLTMSMARKADEDLSHRKNLERVRNEFLGNVSHELRTPIFTVQGFLETLLDGAIDDPAVRDEFLQKAHDNIVRLHTLLNDLIEISRIESGEMKMSFRYFDIVDLCRGTIVNLADKSAMHMVHLTFEVEKEHERGLEVYADRKRIEQVLVNLLDNAIKYNRPEGSVVLRLHATKKHVEISVEDDGPGISEEDLDRIFERFYRIEKGRSRQVGGSGLGLSIVKHIINAHGSTVDVTSDGKRGTTFAFRLNR